MSEGTLHDSGRVFQAVSGIRTDDIAAAAILHKFVQMSGRSAAFPFLVARPAVASVCPGLFKSQHGFVRASVGISLEPEIFSLVDSGYTPIPLYWDNQLDSYRYRGQPGACVTSGESIASALTARLKRAEGELLRTGWLAGDDLDMFISKYADILNMLSSSINLNTFSKDATRGLRINALPYVYSPSQIFMAFACAPESITDLLDSGAVTHFLEDSSERIDKAGRIMVEEDISDHYRFGCITGKALWEADHDNAFASLLKKRDGDEPGTEGCDAIALAIWDPIVNGQVSQLKIRTLRSEAGEIADAIAAAVGRKYARVEKESRNRVNVHIRYLKPSFAGREKIIKKLIMPAARNVYNRQSEETKNTSLLGWTSGYKSIELKQIPKAEKIKNQKESISGGLKRCLETAKQDRSPDF